MKKMLSAVLAAMLLLSAVNAYAYQPSLEFMNKTYEDLNNFTSTCEIGFKLGSNIKIIDKLAKMTESTDIGKIVDLKELAEGLFDTTIKMEASSISAHDKMSCEAKISSSAPLKINKNLELNVNSSYYVWADIAKNGDTVSNNYIISMPFAAKYIVMNDEEFEKPGDGASIGETSKILFDNSRMKDINKKNIQSVSKNARVTGNDSNVTVTFTDAGLKAYLADMKDIVWDLYDENTKETLNEIDFSGVENVMRKVKIFDDNALVMNYSVNSDGNPERCDFTLNVNTNASEIAEALGIMNPEFTAENSKIAFTVKGSNIIKYGSARIAKPQLTEDNSMTLSEYAGLTDTEMPEPDDGYYSYIYVQTDGEFVKRDGEILIPLRNLLEEVSYNIVYDNGTITAEANEDSDAEFDKIVILPGGRTEADGTLLEVSPEVINDRAYVTVKEAERLLDASAEEYGYNIQENFNWAGFGRIIK